MTIFKPKQALNKAYLKVKPTRDQIKLFKDNLIKLIDEINLDKREELHKNDFSDFLKDTYYKTSNYINIKDTIDLVVHSSIDPQSPVSILIEAKSPSNRTEMISNGNINTKSMQELILYYLRERVSNNNLNLKHIIITNRYEWFIFDAALFEKLFAQNKQLVIQFNDFENKTLSVTKTKDFYSEIAKPVIEATKDKIEYTYFDIREYKKYLEKDTLENDNKLIPLYKIFSPEHLLKLPIANDNNSLDKSFYSELLHIIGLEETKQGSKKIITRKEIGRRDSGSLLENCIIELDNGDKLSSITNIGHYGATKEERLFNVALELVIIWINRILFLKLLEGQLISFNKNSKDYAFLNTSKVRGYDDLNNLFFGVLAKQQNERSEDNKKLFANIPYLNSSLFDPQSELLEKSCFTISALNYNRTLPIETKTVLKNRVGKKLTGEKNTLEYLFEFLNAYNFASDSNDEIQEDSKTIINAAVLGLIFEKINGYKDGSFYTPSFITMYMCRETIRRAVVEKFNKAKSWNCLSFDELYNKIEDRNEANNLINSITICDPAVGSGHFLVSALNEIIAIKSELRILQDNDGKRLKEYQIEIVNDELIVTDEEGDLFVYNPNSNESQRVQIALFHEKQTIIENCLFGVDINPNSVKICRLRLWIELLKNTYYKNKDNHELETLPNIDINIKCGNSLISRYNLTDDISSALKNLKHSNNKEITVDFYRKVVNQYKNAKTREGKKDLHLLIAKIKLEFSSGLWQASLFDDDANQKHEMEMFYIQQNAFEWRFEFPEILADDGEFIGFDVVIGNPPYLRPRNIAKELIKHYSKYESYESQFDLYHLFIERCHDISNNARVALITPNTFLANANNIKLRKFILNNFEIESILDCKQKIFNDADVDVIIIITGIFANRYLELKSEVIEFKHSFDVFSFAENKGYNFAIALDNNKLTIINKIKYAMTEIAGYFDVCTGIKEYQIGKGVPAQVEEDKISRVFNAQSKIDDSYIKELRGRNISRYGISWSSEYIKYGKWLAEPRSPNYFSGERILIRQIPDVTRFVVSHTDEEYVIDQSIYVAKPIGLQNVKFMLGCLNSRLTYWYFKNLYNEFDSLFPKIKINEFKSLPIPNSTIAKQDDVAMVVNKILEIKKINPLADIYRLEQQIDKLVYELYGLTDDEIKIIEGEMV